MHIRLCSVLMHVLPAHQQLHWHSSQACQPIGNGALSALAPLWRRLYSTSLQVTFQQCKASAGVENGPIARCAKQAVLVLVLCVPNVVRVSHLVTWLLIVALRSDISCWCWGCPPAIASASRSWKILWEGSKERDTVARLLTSCAQLQSVSAACRPSSGACNQTHP